ncbi:MAG: HAMP domain-containing histidine kinase, partial [Chloroflexi bacterium]|nr:HAMP domain-containing histidine kinase [Chloroflexota bacterium]
NAMAERLQETHRSREVFISAVAHDLKNLLTPFLGTVQLLPRWEEFPPDRRQHLLGLLRDQAQRLDALVTDLLDVSRIEARRFTVAPAPADLVALTRRVVEEQQTTTVRHRLLLEAPERLEGSWDAHRLAQVLTNLVNNAIKYSPEGGDVQVAARCRNGAAEVCITDHGVGMAAEDISLIFEPYTRLYRERRAGGLGLGLYIARGIVEAHGGRIWCQSPGPGQGTTFCFTLPR